MSNMYQIYENLRLRTSDRYWATSEHPSLLAHPRQQYFTSGFRAVRTALSERFVLPGQPGMSTRSRVFRRCLVGVSWPQTRAIEEARPKFERSELVKTHSFR